MPTYTVTGETTVEIEAEVEARSAEEAKTLAADQIGSLIVYGNSDLVGFDNTRLNPSEQIDWHTAEEA